MTQFSRLRLGTSVFISALGFAFPAWAQVEPEEPAGILSRVLDFSYRFDFTVVAVMLAAAVAGAASYVIWYRFALVGDLRAQRGAGSTRIAALGLAATVFGGVFTLIAQFGVAWFLAFSFVGAVLALIGRATTLAIGMFVLSLFLVVARIYGWI